MLGKQIPKFQNKKVESFPEESQSVNTMHDDLAGLLTGKNQKKDNRSSGSKNIQRNLAEVYNDGSGDALDMTKLEKIERPIWKTVMYTLIGVFSFLLLAAIGGFLVFNRLSTDTFTNERITLKIEPPLTIVSGQEGDYTITITNKEKVNLYNARLELFYPENFEVVSENPPATGDNKNLWDFSVLKTGETKKIEIKGKLLAALNTSQTFKGILDFKPENLNANFKQETAVDVLVDSSIVSLEITGPDKALANQEIQYVLKYKNTTDAEIADLQLLVPYPQGFVFASAVPEPEAGTNGLWKIAKIPAQGEGEIKIKGSYSAVNEAGNQEFKASLQLKYNGDFYPQSEPSKTTEVIKDQLTLQLIVNGSAQDQPISFGDLLVYTLNYKNTGQEELKNIEITANLNSEILDWQTLINESRGTVKAGAIIFNSKNIAKLAKLNPGEAGEIVWQIRVKDASTVTNEKVSKFSVENQMEAKFQPASGDQITVKTKPLVNSINSDLSLSAEARYYNDDNTPLGLGPIQPKVGEESTYNIRLKLNNNLHEIKDIRVEATLPKNVAWANKESQNTGDLTFSSSANKVVWTIARLPKTARETEASFNVKITPGNESIGRVLILILGASLTAKDAETGADIAKSVKAITTAFNDPIVGPQSGIVE